MTLPKLYPILDTAVLAAREFPVLEAAEGVLEAGATLLQLRHKGSFTRSAFELTEDLADLCRHFDATLIVNDRADVARLVDAGLHVGQDDLQPTLARRILPPGSIMGLSTHNKEQLRAIADEPLDYAALGPIFKTGSKKKPDPVVGLKQLSAWRKHADLPLVAIGGITRENAGSALAAGADSVAVISDLLPEENGKEAIRARVEEWLRIVNR
jgi:thiamine-phosphate pyrophosphorylase